MNADGQEAISEIPEKFEDRFFWECNILAKGGVQHNGTKKFLWGFIE